jgi:uncharacterized protein with NAD-binding domain and iron-sulfur cluster
MIAPHVVVIGGGLAGVTSAIGLREAGFDVTLLEARPRLGGAASSFARGDLTIDNGQHVFLRCCTSYQDLLARLGVSDLVTMQERFDVTVLSAHGEARLRRTALPGPMHMGRALAGYRMLSRTERLKVARAALALRSIDPADPAIDGVALGDWLASKGQSEQARRKLWDLFIVSALNIGGDEASLALSATVIKMALLGKKDAADIGMAAAPLGDLHGRAAAGLLGKLGAQVRLGAKAAAVERLPGGGFRIALTGGASQRGADSAGPVPDGRSPDDRGPDGRGPDDQGHDERESDQREGNGAVPEARAADGPLLLADSVVLAVPPGQAARLAVMAGLEDASRWTDLGASPIVNVHVVYDRRVTSLPFAAAVDSPVQWVFDKTSSSGLAAGQYLAVSLSAADTYVEIPAASLRQQFLPALEQLFPAAAGAEVTDFFVTRERRATFRQAPGIGALRPGTATSVPGFVLAGAWTDTGWPDTMEGAVRSGQQAAEELTRWLARQPAPNGAGRRQAATAQTGAPS